MVGVPETVMVVGQTYAVVEQGLLQLDPIWQQAAANDVSMMQNSVLEQQAVEFTSLPSVYN